MQINTKNVIIDLIMIGGIPMIVDNKGKIFEDRRKSNKNVEKDRRKEIQIEKNKVNSKKKK